MDRPEQKSRFFRAGALLAPALFTLAVAAGGCESDRQRLNEADNGGSVSLWRGDTLEVELSGNPTTGYTWEVAQVNTNILRQSGAAQYTASSDAAGSGGWYRFRFEAVGGGQTPLRLAYHQPWVAAATNDRTFEVSVTVVTNR